MKYKFGDKLKVKSIEWYDENKDTDDSVNLIDNNNGPYNFTEPMSKFCGHAKYFCDMEK